MYSVVCYNNLKNVEKTLIYIYYYGNSISKHHIIPEGGMKYLISALLAVALVFSCDSDVSSPDPSTENIISYTVSESADLTKLDSLAFEDTSSYREDCFKVRLYSVFTILSEGRLLTKNIKLFFKTEF